MLPCCHLCYEKYIKENDEIDYIRFEEIRTKHLELLNEEMNHKMFSKKNKFKEIKETLLNMQPCKCICHKDNVKCLH